MPIPLSNVRLGDCLTVLTDYHANGSYERLKENVTLLDTPDYAVMIRTTNFEKNDFEKDLKYIDEHAYNYLAKSQVNPGDILMNKIASPGSVYRMPNLGKPVSLAMNLFLLRSDESRLNQAFAYYWLKANELYVKSFACGAATATITKKAVRELKLQIPDIASQKKIAGILLTYDDLIENSQRRIRTLESMVRALYREWFVNFRFPGHESVSFVPSPLGEIPQGWEVRKVAEFADFTRGFEPGSDAYKKEPGIGLVKFLRVGDLSKRDSGLFIDEHLVQGRVLKALDIAITLDGSVGEVRLGLEGAYSSGIRRVDVKDTTRLGWVYTYQLLLSDACQATIQAHSKGTTIKHAGSAVAALEFVSPPAIVIKSFEKIAAPMMLQVLSLQEQVENLGCTRDLLLPRLLSGQIEIETEVT